MSELVGRVEELAGAMEILGSQRALVMVAGEAGIGKTRFIRELAERADTELGATTVWARPDQVTAPGPFAYLLDLVADVSALGDSQTEEALALQRELATSPKAPAIPHVAARLRGLIATVGPRPIVVFEDLHWSDSASHAVILRMARALEGDGYSIIASYRSDEMAANHELARFVDALTRERLGKALELRRLGPDEATSLARSILGSQGDTEILSWIVETSEGVPFFVEELSEHRKSAKGIPESITRAVLARTDVLPTVSLEVLGTAALMVGPVEVDILSAACEIARPDVVTALIDAQRAGVIEERSGQLLFRHAIVRETLKNSLVSLEAEGIHARLARAIESTRAAELELHAKSLAHHWYEAREPTLAMDWALRAGKRALSLAATFDAQAAFELAIACGGPASPPEALMGLAEVEVREGTSTAAAELLTRAAEGFRERGDVESASRALARRAWLEGADERHEALATLDQATLLLPDEAPYAVARLALMAQKGQVLLQAFGNVEEAEPLLRAAASRAAELENHVVRAESLDGLAWAAEFGGRVSEALTISDEARSEALISEEAETIGRTHNNSALLLLTHGDPREAIQILTVARGHLHRSFGRSGLAVIDLTEALAHFKQGNPASVETLVARGEIGWIHWRGYTRILQVWAALHRGDDLRAASIVKRYWSELGVVGDPGALSLNERPREFGDALTCSILVSLEQGRDCVHESDLLVEVREHDAPEDRLSALCLATRARTNSAKDPTHTLQRIDDELSRYAAPYFAASYVELKSAAEAKSGALSAALDRYAVAIDLYSQFENLADRARAIRARAELGNQAESGRVQSLKSARELALEAGSNLEVARTESALRALGVRPRAGRPRKTEAEGGGRLTAREEEIAGLIALGSTNGEIANRLFLSERTVQDHVTHALRKLGLSGRAGLAAWAAKRGLV